MLHVATFKADELDSGDRRTSTPPATASPSASTPHRRARRARVASASSAGNIYVNRNQIGAVVGSQPFGGEGLSGTGPKAGGPHYLAALLASARSPRSRATDQRPFRPFQSAMPSPPSIRFAPRLRKSRAGASRYGHAWPHRRDQRPDTQLPRGIVLCLGPDEASARIQAQLALAHHNGVLVIAPGATAHRQRSGRRRLGHRRRRQTLAPAAVEAGLHIDAIMHFGDERGAEALAAGAGAPRRRHRAAGHQRGRCHPAFRRAPHLHRHHGFGRQCRVARGRCRDVDCELMRAWLRGALLGLVAWVASLGRGASR